MWKTIRIEPLDPLMLRDGRPFETEPGVVARSMDMVSSSTVAGAVRTMLGKAIAGSRSRREIYDSALMKELVKSELRGPLYQLGDQIFFPFPQDMELYEEAEGIRISIRRPCSPELTDGFLGSGRLGQFEDVLWPPVMMLPESKPLGESRRPALVSADLMLSWLCGGEAAQEVWKRAINQWCSGNVQGPEAEKPDFLAALPREVRMHTAIDPVTYGPQREQLFGTESLVFPQDVSLVTRIKVQSQQLASQWPEQLSRVHTLGGERRLVHFSELREEGAIWSCPDQLRRTLAAEDEQEKKYIRMILATPAYFAKGWRPGWLDDKLESTSALLDGVKLKLRWACVPRWQPVSGWSYNPVWPSHARATNGEKEQGKPVKPVNGAEKAVRRLVPAGSVYFFEVMEGSLRHLVEQKWLISVSDQNRRKGSFDREDGFGLALWGRWSPNSDSGKTEGDT